MAHEATCFCLFDVFEPTNRPHDKSLLLHWLHRRRSLLHDVASFLVHVHQRIHRHFLVSWLIRGRDLDVRSIVGGVLGGQPHDHDRNHQQQIEEIPNALIHSRGNAVEETPTATGTSKSSRRDRI